MIKKLSKNFFIDLHSIAHRAMMNYGFFSTFPRNVLRQAQELDGQTPLAGDNDSVKDLSSFLWSSIDNKESRDLDQLEYCERASRQEIRVMVAVADVDGYVEKSSPVDRHAGHNGTSVYAGVEIFPMLPERLCTDLSSLNEGEDRRAVVMEFFVLKDGGFRPGGVYRAFVHNKAQLVYESIGDWLDGKSSLPEKAAAVDGLEDQLRLQDEAAQRLRQYRLEQGALELETIEPNPVIQDDTVVDLLIKPKNRARLLIENFMIAANGTMVAFLEQNNSPMIQRVVRTPERWEKIVAVAEELGEPLPSEPDSRALCAFLIRQKNKDPERFPDISLTIVKLLGSGEYVLNEPGKPNVGHFGLAVQDYTHSTAPNRRYVDLVIQRLLKAVIDEKNMPYSKKQLSEVAVWCTDRARSARKVERFMRKVAGAFLLRDRIGDVFEGIITGASEKGTYVRLLNPPVEGRVTRGQAGLDVGEKISVRLIHMELEKGHIDFETKGK